LLKKVFIMIYCSKRKACLRNRVCLHRRLPSFDWCRGPSCRGTAAALVYIKIQSGYHSMASAPTKAEQLAEAKKRVREAFIIFEHKEGSKLVDAKELPVIVRSLGINPTTAQVQALQQRIAAALAPPPATPPAAAADGSTPAAAPPATPPAAATSPAFLALEQCEGLIAAWLLESKDALQRDDYHTLLRAFKALDPENTGYIEADKLEQLLGSCEDALSPEELNNMLSVSADDQGRVLYQEFALRLATDGRPI
jgi:Ca2+-binding EF-hand superfamily protein